MSEIDEQKSIANIITSLRLPLRTQILKTISTTPSNEINLAIKKSSASSVNSSNPNLILSPNEYYDSSSSGTESNETRKDIKLKRLPSNLNRAIFRRNYIKRQQKVTISNATSSSSLNTSTNQNDSKRGGEESSCLLRIKTNKLGSSMPNLALDVKKNIELNQSKTEKNFLKLNALNSFYSSVSLCSTSSTLQSPIVHRDLIMHKTNKIDSKEEPNCTDVNSNNEINNNNNNKRLSFLENTDNHYETSSGYESSESKVMKDDDKKKGSNLNVNSNNPNISLNESILLKSPLKSLNNSLIKQRNSRSCSPMPKTSRQNSDSDIILIQNEKFKEKFPKACKQMEENLQNFIETNKDLNKIDELHDPAARFIHNQIIELANWCLEKSRQNQLTCAYFDEMTNSLEKLLIEASDKCINVETSVNLLRKFVKKFLLIVSRVARLLECLEFDPEEFCHLLNAAEQQAKRNILINYNDIPKYIISKLGLNKRDPFEEFAASINAETKTENKNNNQQQLTLSLSNNNVTINNDQEITSQSSNSNININSNNNNNNNTSSSSQFISRDGPKESDFEKIKLISNGAYGAVYLVRYKQQQQNQQEQQAKHTIINDELINKRFAMKEIKKHDLILRNQLKQVFTERDIMIFTDNPFVVALICTFETKKHLCMVMEYVEGGDVATLIKNMGPLPLDMARTYFAETTLAVEYLHNYGIIHRDLKPDNLLITSLGHIKLTDFGLSKVGLMNLTTNFYEGDYMKDHYCKEFNDKQICGTPQYLAPEVILRQSYGKAVDWWSMGIILYEFLTSIAPYNGATPEELFDNVINSEIEWPDDDDQLKIPDDAKDLINGLLQHDPMHRLGADSGALEIKKHLFFYNLDWDNLLRIKAKFIPELEGPDDTSYFDTRSDRYNHDDQGDDELVIFKHDLSKNSFNKSSISNKLDEQIVNKTKNDSNTDRDLFASFPSCSSRFKMCRSGSNFENLENSVVLRSSESDPKKISKSSNELNKFENEAKKTETNEPKLSLVLKVKSESNLLKNKLILKDQVEIKQSNKIKISKHDAMNISCEPEFLDTSIIASNERNKFISKPPLHTKKNIKTKDVSLNQNTIIDRKCNFALNNATTDCINVTNTSVVLRPSRLINRNLRPKSMIVHGSNLNNQYNNKFRHHNPLLNSHNTNMNSYTNDISNNLFINQYNDSAVSEMIYLALNRPEVLIKKNYRGFGFTMRTIQVYYDDTDFFSIQHLIIQVEENSPAHLAGLKINDLITHVNDQIVCGVAHHQLIQIILSNNPLRLRCVNLNETRIKTNGRKRSPSKIKYAQPVYNQPVNRFNQSFHQMSHLDSASMFKMNSFHQVGHQIDRRKSLSFNRKLNNNCNNFDRRPPKPAFQPNLRQQNLANFASCLINENTFNNQFDLFSNQIKETMHQNDACKFVKNSHFNTNNNISSNNNSNNANTVNLRLNLTNRFNNNRVNSRPHSMIVSNNSNLQSFNTYDLNQTLLNDMQHQQQSKLSNKSNNSFFTRLKNKFNTNKNQNK